MHCTMSASAQPSASGARHSSPPETAAGARHAGAAAGIDTVTRPRRVGTGFPDRDSAGASSTGTGFPDPVVGARLLLARAMLRGAPPVDDVTFTAPCPACGRACEWHQVRIDTRMRATIHCDCAD
jgi:hypothetical protein